MKKYRVYIYHHPAEPETPLGSAQRELWLGYTRPWPGKFYKGCFTVDAETRAKAISEAIRMAKCFEVVQS